MFDHMTPRDISMTRYTRNHEWMEEVLGSAYRIGQITPADLGLGLQGELSSLTQGIFEAPGIDAHKKPPAKPVVGRLDPELADQFKKRIADKIRADQTEMAKMKAKHEKQMARFESNSIVVRSEKELRVAVEETGPEFWRLEGQEVDEEDSNGPFNAKQHRKVDEIVADVESALGRHIEVVRGVQRVQDGGFQEPAPEPEALPMPAAAPTAGAAGGTGPNQHSRPSSHAGSQNSGVMVGETDVDMGGTAAGMMQPGVPPNLPQTNMPAFPPAGVMSANAATSSAAVGQAQISSNVPEDVTMQDSHQVRDINAAPDQGTGSGDWVVIPKGGVSPGASGGGPPATAPSAAPSEPTQTPGDGNKAGESDFGDMNTAGEALSSYDQQNDGDLGDGMDLGVEDSAFGDAVFGVEESRDSAADTPADGM